MIKRCSQSKHEIELCLDLQQQKVVKEITGMHNYVK